MNSELVTVIPPGTGGVRDYAEIMGRHIPTRIIAPTAQTPLAEYGNGAILLNFSGYGFHPRGIPSWLVERLGQLRARGSKVGIFFHELFASEPPWRSAFWLGPTQRRIAADLAGLSDFWLTNADMAAQWLRPRSPGTPNRVLPVYSNVGEPCFTRNQRSQKIVVFGGPAIRSNAYRELDENFWRWVRNQGLTVHDIGPPIQGADYAKLRADGRIQAHGALPASQVSAHLSDAKYGILCYPPQVVSKSGVFAAYCAHGTCTVLFAKRYNVHDGLEPNRHYAAGFSAVTNNANGAAEIGASAHAWYTPHRVEAHVDAVKTLLAGAS
ncbi:hypothetical protein QTI66_19195 [Variovorax sp. J22R133]|uniref:hypothetical protein n=1 Tax=Variovorax brevis TaxID=3053503 RepID=UPI002574F6D1|nr:hypothetical protein [Variovorax sp. J22R133]MDM0114288.1 hypothetical protein [Variovorax sp. J22R133]